MLKDLSLQINEVTDSFLVDYFVFPLFFLHFAFPLHTLTRSRTIFLFLASKDSFFFLAPCTTAKVLDRPLFIMTTKEPILALTVTHSNHTETRLHFQVIKMLVMVVSLFALLWLPYRSLLVYNSFAATETDKYMDLWFLMFAKTCVYINR